MESFIANLFHSFTGSIGALARNIESWVSTWWTFFTSLVARWLAAFQACVNNAVALGFALFNFAENLYLTFQWFLVHVLPGIALQAFDQSIFWAEARVRQAENLIHLLISDLRAYDDWAIAILRRWALDAINAVIANVGTLWNRFLGVEQRVAALLTHPEVLAQWLAGVIVQAVVRWAVANGAFLFTLFRKNAIGLGRSIAVVLENIITQTLM